MIFIGGDYIVVRWKQGEMVLVSKCDNDYKKVNSLAVRCYFQIKQISSRIRGLGGPKIVRSVGDLPSEIIHSYLSHTFSISSKS